MDENSIFPNPVNINAITYPSLSLISVGKKDLQTKEIKILELNHCAQRHSRALFRNVEIPGFLNFLIQRIFGPGISYVLKIQEFFIPG